MKKFSFILLFLLIVLFFGCTENPSTGRTVKSAVIKVPLNQEIQKSEIKEECQGNESQPCITLENCPGKRSCVNGLWQECSDIPGDNCPIKQECKGNCDCTEEWDCTEWTECKKGAQTRKCVDVNECATEKNKPDTIRLCT
jgi:hypothetical protein